MKNRRHARRVKRLALICTLCTVILVVSTYAWFIGMRTVNVSSFDVQIAATDGLTLSLNGKDYAETIQINSSNYNKTNVVYEGNTNTWGDTGLIPISTVGKIDTDASRLILYEKGSLTVTPGGYRLMASRVDNHTTLTGEEGKGFVAFDLFIRNLSGNAYYAEFNELNEEAIYLTQSSEVKVLGTGTLGDGSETDDSINKQIQTGIENSVRVAFAQIGRVKAVKGNDISSSGKVSVITGITCTDDSENEVTGTCGKDAKIWEPNDMKHVRNAINWYKESCNKRFKGSNTSSTDYSMTELYTNEGVKASCNTNFFEGEDPNYTITDYVQTYAINSEIDYKDMVDVYDGADYNTYTGSTKLTAYDYYTDTEKMETGVDRIPFFSLAPNSITKVRVYIYLEGQDIDNYDFASLGKKIQVNFGFTKERFYNTDIDYDGPEATNDGILIPKTNNEVGNATTEVVGNE